jgi:hypothetical protein
MITVAVVHAFPRKHPQEQGTPDHHHITSNEPQITQIDADFQTSQGREILCEIRLNCR